MKPGHVALFFAAALCSCQDAQSSQSAASLAASNPCEVGTSSRWLSGGGNFQRTAIYGDSDSEEIIDMWGLDATPEGRIIIFDAGATRVLILDEDLKVVRRVGREGKGPGEFVYQRALHGDWVLGTDSGFVVMDYRAISTFDASGSFMTYATADPPMPMPIMKLGMIADEVVYAANIVDSRAGTRTLETRALKPGGTTLIRKDSMPTLPMHAGRPVRGIVADQAEPLWAVADPCIFVSDGAGDWILRASSESGATDTIRLPSRDIPKRTAEDEQHIERLRRRGAAVGMNTGNGNVDPTARLKWSSLVVDPDGFLWLEPWRPRSQRDQEVTALVVNPANGKVDSVVLPRFPDAFLPGGSIVSTTYNERLGRAIVEKFSPTERAGANG